MNTFTRAVFFLILCLSYPEADVLAQAPVANFTANVISGCAPLAVNFTNTSTNATSYYWTFGNGNNSSLTSPSAIYPNSGTFTVTLVAYNGAQQNTKTMTITVADTSVINISASPTSGCPPLNVQFAPIVSGLSATTYTWNFGNGGSSNLSSPQYTFINSQYYTITLQITNSGGCVSTLQIPNYIHVYAKPTASFTATPVNSCSAPATVTFNSTTTGGLGPYSITWDYGDFSTGTGASSVHTYQSTGSYTVAMIAQDANGCKDTLTQPNYINLYQVDANFSGPDSACQSTNQSFNGTVLPTTATVTWYWGDGGSSTGINGNHSWTNPGQYQIMMVAAAGPCTDTVYKTIYIHPKPIISFSASPLPPCPAPSNVTFTNATTNGVSWLWDFGDNTTSTAQNPVHTYYQNGHYDITLYATSDHGCTAGLTLTSYLNIDPLSLSIYANPKEGCIPLTVNYGVGLTYSQPATSVLWNFGSSTSTSFNPIKTYTAYGTYPVSLTVTTANGCTATVYDTIRAGTPPIANFGAAPTSICVGDFVQFTDSSQFVTNWLWDFGDGTTTNVQNPNHIYQTPGYYTVTLIVSNNGCKDTMIKTNYIHVNWPKSIGGAVYNCANPLLVNFTNASQNYTSCKWYFGDGGTSFAATPSHVYAALGTYIVSLVTYNDTTGCDDSISMQIDLFNVSLAFTATDTAFCRGDSIILTAYPTGGPVIKYDWLIGSHLLQDTTASIKYTFNTAGVYTVKLITMDAHGCIDTLTKPNWIIVSWPQVAITAVPTTGCAPMTVQFTDATPIIPGTTITSRIWDLGNGVPFSTTGTTTSYTYTAAGNYYVRLSLVTNIGCADSLTLYNYIQVHKPQANFSVSANTNCPGVPITFINTSVNLGPVTCLWHFGDGVTSTASNPQHAYTTTGTYTVKLVITDAYGCKDSIIKVNHISIIPKPNASFTMSDTFRICPPMIVNFTNTSTGGSTYNWVFGNNVTSNLINPSAVYTPGVYTPMLVVSNAAGCKDTAYGKARVLGYDGAMTYTPLSGCAPLTVHFTVHEHNVPNFVFDFADGVTYATTDTFATHTYTHAGGYVPLVLMSDGAGCNATSKGIDTIKVDGVIGGFTYSPYPACDKGTLTFLDTSKGSYSTINSRLWIFHDNSTSTLISPVKNYQGPGTYNITMIHTTTTGCKDTLKTSVTFWPLPTVDAGADSIICVSDSAMLMPGGAVSYLWSPGTSLSCTACTNPYAFPVAPTTYYVTGTDIHGCKNSDSVKIMLQTKTTSVVGPGGEICESDSLQLYASGAHQYTWLPPTGLNNSHIPNPKTGTVQSITYMVIAKEGSCIADTNYVDVIVHPRPHVNAGPDVTMIAGDMVPLNATAHASTIKYEWTPAEGLSCTGCNNPEARPKRTTDYKVVATTDWGCSDSDFVKITVICQSSQLYIPNSFTPNGNSVNDRFYPRGKGIKLIKTFKVYDRWGEVVFDKKNIQINDINEGWDGTFKGKDLPPDVYVFMIEGVCDTDEEFTWKSDISLIR